MSEAEAMGAYEAVYDEYEEGLESGEWIQRDGTSISISKMSTSHIRNCIRLCEVRSESSTFSNDSHKWECWINAFEDELFARTLTKRATKTKTKTKKASKTIKAILNSTKSNKLLMTCFCGKQYIAKRADLNRGWALSCCKSCASIRREFGREMPTFVKEL